jgi:hypothetical protein
LLTLDPSEPFIAIYQRYGIGSFDPRDREKIGPESMLVLIAAPKGAEYYPRMGFTKHDSAWILRAGDESPMCEVRRNLT